MTNATMASVGLVATASSIAATLRREGPPAPPPTEERTHPPPRIRPSNNRLDLPVVPPELSFRVVVAGRRPAASGELRVVGGRSPPAGLAPLIGKAVTH